MIIEVLFAVCMLLWLLSALPLPAIAPFAPFTWVLAWLAVLFLGLRVFAALPH
jgi:hypothetical protein